MNRPLLLPDQLRRMNFFQRLNVDPIATEQDIELAFRHERERYRVAKERNPVYVDSYFLIEEAYNGLKNPEIRSAQGNIVSETPREKTPISWPAVAIWVVVFVASNLLVGWWAYNADVYSSIMFKVIICAAVALIAVVRFSRAGRNNSMLAALVLGAMLCANAVYIDKHYKKQRLYLDNANEYMVEVRIDGNSAATLSTNNYFTVDVRVGDHNIEAYKQPGDSLLETFDVVVEDGPSFLYNVLSAGTYVVTTETYSKYAYFQQYEPSPRFEIGGRWIALTYDYIFSSTPGEIYVSDSYGGSDEETRTSFLRASKPRDTTY